MTITTTTNTLQFDLRNKVHLLATGFGSGLVPVAPGTVGTIAAIPFYMMFAFLPWTWLFVATLAICLFGPYICGKAADDIGVHDHKAIVWDEFAGLFITMCFVPFSWTALALGFVLFRIFDVLKPWPISLMDKKLEGGFGIMMDDVAAGLAAGVCLALLMPHLI